MENKTNMTEWFKNLYIATDNASDSYLKSYDEVVARVDTSDVFFRGWEDRDMPDEISCACYRIFQGAYSDLLANPPLNWAIIDKVIDEWREEDKEYIEDTMDTLESDGLSNPVIYHFTVFEVDLHELETRIIEALEEVKQKAYAHSFVHSFPTYGVTA